jgi:hypothetical protein
MPNSPSGGARATGSSQYLTAQHKLVQRVTDIGSFADLRIHLTIWHHMNTTTMTKGEMAAWHLMAHACLAFPDAAEALGFRKDFGKP